MDCKAVPFSSSSPPICLELYVPSVMSEPKKQTFLLLLPYIREKVRQNFLRTGDSNDLSHNQQSNNLREEQ